MQRPVGCAGCVSAVPTDNRKYVHSDGQTHARDGQTHAPDGQTRARDEHAHPYLPSRPHLHTIYTYAHDHRGDRGRADTGRDTHSYDQIDPDIGSGRAFVDASKWRQRPGSCRGRTGG